MSGPTPSAENGARCWRSECRTGCYYPDVCDQRPSAEDDAPDVDARRRAETARFADPATARVAFVAHDVYHDGLRCGYACDFWHGLVVAFREVESASLLATLQGPDPRVIPPEE